MFPTSGDTLVKSG